MRGLIVIISIFWSVFTFSQEVIYQTQFEDEKHQYEVYTYALKLGLECDADSDDNGEITVTELKRYLYAKVEELTNGKQKQQQGKKI